MCYLQVFTLQFQQNGILIFNLSSSFVPTTSSPFNQFFRKSIKWNKSYWLVSVAQCFNIENTPGDSKVYGDLVLLSEKDSGLLLVSFGTYIAELPP